MSQTDQLSVTFAALADPTRRAILERLAEGEATVGELAEPFPMSLPAVSRHLKVLERAGLIARNRSAQWRPSTLRTEPLEEATNWLETYRVIWEGRMDRLDAHLKRIQKGPKR
jgi:DNA-binding transcriptional ArsR family regulator